MAVIYSYPTDPNPSLSDLIIGTDVSSTGNPTKSFTIGSIVALVQSNVPGGGTLTQINTAGTTFIDLVGGPITTSGTITASLSAGGTPSTTTFLRGDNTWATPDIDAAVTYVIRSVQAGNDANILLTGSDASQTIVGLLAGANIQFTDNGSNGITVDVVNLLEGTVESVNPGDGLKLQSGDVSVNPTIGVETIGSNNYITVNKITDVVDVVDYIPFHDVSSGDVKTTTFNTIPVESLVLVKDYIDAGDNGDVRNDTDTFTTTGVVNQIVSLDSTEYAGLASKDPNTLYVVIASNPDYTVTQSLVNNITGGTAGVDYTLTGPGDGATVVGVAGTPYSFTVSAQPITGKYFSSAFSATNPSGVIAADATVVNTLTGTIADIPAAQCTATLAISNSIQGNSSWYTIGGNLAGATDSGACPHTYAFNTTVTPVAGYQFVSGPTITNASGTISGNQTVTTFLSGTVEAIPSSAVTATLNVNTSGVTGETSQFVLSGDQTGATQSGNSPLSYSFTTGIAAKSGYEFTSGPNVSNANGTITASQTVVTTITGNIAEIVPASCTATLEVDNQITGPSAGYTIGGDQDGTTDAGNCPNTYSFNTTVSLNSGYVWTQNPVINNASGTLTGGPDTVTTTITGIVAAQVQNVTATLDVTSNITGPNVYTIVGDGATSTGSAPHAYTFSPSVSIPSGYSWINGPTWNPPLPIQGTISANTTVPATVTGEITSCYAENLYYSATTTCPTSNLSIRFMDTSNLCTATKLYASSNDCGSTNYAPSGYYKTFSGQNRFWNGTSFGGSCTSCGF
jgi:hypothetical protein